MSEMELMSLDLRYEGYRMRNRARETRLLASISERGIVEPLEGVELEERPVLLNGFKRLRCARRLGLAAAPYVSLGEDVATGIAALLRGSYDRALTLLEQAGFVDELKQAHAMSVGEIAELLSRSKAWVSLRLGVIGELPPQVRDKLFGGAFPVYAYLYHVRPFMRINKQGRAQAEELVMALSGKGLSVREIARLAQGFFHGSDALREQIRAGHLALPLDQLKSLDRPAEGCSPLEQALLRDLQGACKYMRRVTSACADKRLESAAFKAQAQLLLGGLLGQAETFYESARSLHDRCGQV